MVRSEIEVKLKAVIAEILGFKEEQIGNEDKLIEDLGINSSELIELTIAVKEVFNLRIPNDAWGSDDMDTVQDMINFVCDKKIDPPRY